ncbi:hypothetical protein IFR05_005160 [Cadophora sp. M221]|nr:hypothetical protein IFR05_005160 [Cadophora sp. M221]
MDEQDHSREDWYEEEGDQTQRHQAQRDEIVGVGYVEPDYSYYCGICKVQKRVAVMMSKEDLIRHGTSNKGLGHRLIGSMVEGFVGCAILEDRRIAGRATGRVLEQAAPTLTVSPRTSALPPGNMIKQSRLRSKKSRRQSSSQDFDLGTNNSDIDCQELSALELGQFNCKFPINPPMASPKLSQQGLSRAAGLDAGMATHGGTRVRATTESAIATKKRGVALTDLEEAGVGKDGKITRKSSKVRKKEEIFEVQMTGVTIKAQRSHMVGDKRTFESPCNTFQAEVGHSTKTRPSSNRTHRSMTAGNQDPPTTSGTPNRLLVASIRVSPPD